MKAKPVILFLTALWTLLGIIEIVRNYTRIVFSGAEFIWPRAFSFAGSYTVSWIILTPFIYYAFYRTLLHSNKWTYRIGIQIAFSIFFGALHLTFNYALYALIYHPDTTFLTLFYGLMNGFSANAINSITIYWVGVLVLLAFSYYEQYQLESTKSIRLESDLNKAQLSALKMQLQPHFLFNALNTISMIVRRKSNDEAIEMISSLSDMLRYSLLSTQKDFVTLEEEIEMLGKYLEIEQIRFQDRLIVNYEIDEGAEKIEVPNLLLQPFVENAFKHGISSKMEEARLHISASVKKDYIMIKVFNNGELLPEDWKLEHSSGIGLQNSLDRLKTAYGDNCSLLVRNIQDPKGVEVRIGVPLEKKDEI